MEILLQREFLGPTPSFRFSRCGVGMGEACIAARHNHPQVILVQVAHAWENHLEWKHL